MHLPELIEKFVLNKKFNKVDFPELYGPMIDIMKGDSGLYFRSNRLKTSDIIFS